MSDPEKPSVDDRDPEAEAPVSSSAEDFTASETESAREARPSRDESRPKRRKGSRAPAPAPKKAVIATGSAIGLAVAALAVGAVAGWFGHGHQAKSAIRADAAAAGSAAGACGAWQTKICSATGKESASCADAKAAADILTTDTCETALGAVPATLAKIKTARASCEKLVGKLCSELPPNSSTCTMVRERTPSFPRERCDAMLENYDQVISELKMLDQRGGPPAMNAPGTPPGMPPGAPQ